MGDLRRVCIRLARYLLRLDSCGVEGNKVVTVSYVLRACVGGVGASIIDFEANTDVISGDSNCLV